MAFKSSPVVLGTTDTDVYEMPVGLEGAVVVGIFEKSGNARTFGLKFYKQSTATTTVLAAAVAVTANQQTKVSIPICMEPGDKIIMSASDADSLVVFPTITQSSEGASVAGFDPQGDYASGTTYAKNAIVRVDADAKTYLSMQDGNIGHTPSSNPDWWMAFVEDGPVGDIAATIHAASEKTTPVDADELGIVDSAASNVLKKLTWANLKATLKTYFDTLYASLSGAVFTGAIQTTTIEAGHATDTTISRAAAGVIAVEGIPLYPGIPQNSKSAAYTLVLDDAQKHIFHPAADTTARIWTIPANSSVAYPIGTCITFINENGAGVITIAITTDTMRLAGAGTTGSRTLAANGIATAVKVTSTSWIIAGTGLT